MRSQRRREVFFPKYFSESGGSYRFEFYRNGFPVEMFRLERVVEHPLSKSLLIPWEVRLKHYLSRAREKETTRPLKPFHRGFLAFDYAKVKSRGIRQIKVTLLVKKDGTTELVKGDPQLTDAELANLSLDIKDWQFFPSLKKGKPYDMKVALPLNF